MLKNVATQKNYLILEIVLAVICLGFLIAGFCSYKWYDSNRKKMVEVSAIVAMVDEDDEIVTYYFRLNDASYIVSDSSYYSSEIKTGDIATIYVNPDNPYDIMCAKLVIVSYVFLGIALLLLAIMLAIYCCYAFKKRRIQSIIDHGIKRNLPVLRYVPVSKGLNNKAYKLVVAYKDKEYSSELFTCEEELYPDATINLFFGKGKSYYIDLSSYKKVFINFDKEF